MTFASLEMHLGSIPGFFMFLCGILQWYYQVLNEDGSVVVGAEILEVPRLKTHETCDANWFRACCHRYETCDQWWWYHMISWFSPYPSVYYVYILSARSQVGAGHFECVSPKWPDCFAQCRTKHKDCWQMMQCCPSCPSCGSDSQDSTMSTSQLAEHWEILKKFGTRLPKAHSIGFYCSMVKSARSIGSILKNSTMAEIPFTVMHP